jgi:hypothetical protein
MSESDLDSNDSMVLPEETNTGITDDSQVVTDDSTITTEPDTTTDTTYPSSTPEDSTTIEDEDVDFLKSLMSASEEDQDSSDNDSDASDDGFDSDSDSTIYDSTTPDDSPSDTQQVPESSDTDTLDEGIAEFPDGSATPTDDSDTTASDISSELQGTSDTLSSSNLESYLNEQTGGFELSTEDIQVSDIAIPTFMKVSRKKTYLGLVKSVEQAGILQPLSVTFNPEYLQFKLENGTDKPFGGKRYLLLDGYRRLYAAYRNHIDTVRCTVFAFSNAESTDHLALLFKCLLNKYVPQEIEEINDLSDLLIDAYDAPQDLIEYLLSLDLGDFMKLKDVVNSSNKYPNIMEDLFNHKKTLDAAFKALQAARKKEDKLRLDDTTGIDDIDDAQSVINSDGGQQLSEEETLDILNHVDSDMTDAFTEGVEDGNLAMTEDDYGAQKVHERKPLPPEIRQAVMIRDNFQCVVCRRGAPVWLGSLVVHHPVPVYGGGKDVYDKPVFIQEEDGRIRLNPNNNLVTLCDTCHETLHTIAFKHRGRIPMTQSDYDEMSDEEKEVMKRLKLLISVEAAIDKKLNRNQRALVMPKHRMPGVGYSEVLNAYNSSDESPEEHVIQKASSDSSSDSEENNPDLDSQIENEDNFSEAESYDDSASESLPDDRGIESTDTNDSSFSEFSDNEE